MSFDSLAPHYRWMEFILAGDKLQRCRTAFLPEIQHAGNILLLGEGNGRFLPACRARFSKAHITCVDASAAMLAQARRRLVAGGSSVRNVSFVQADVLHWQPPPRAAFDLIVTNFFLDCFQAQQLEQLTTSIAAVASPDANWLLADFQMAASGLWRLRSQLILRLMYVFFGVVTQLPASRLTKPDPYLQARGFTLRGRIESDWELLHSDWWARTNV